MSGMQSQELAEGGPADDWEDEFEMFDEFVLLEPPKYDEYNTTENLNKERNRLVESQG